jgi:drug/metabolite transporter (DMT)-like permease
VTISLLADDIPPPVSAFVELIVYTFLSKSQGQLTQAIPDPSTGANLLMLAIIPTVVSNLTLVEAIKYIGATQTSVLGAMEPVTAVIVGITVFGESFSLTIAAGILLIISAVTIIILKK